MSFALAQHTAVKSLALCAQLPFCGSGRLYLQSLVFATLDKPHSLSPFQSNCSSLTVWEACNQLNCSDTGLEPQTECSALECTCCALRSGMGSLALLAVLLLHRPGCPGSSSVCCVFQLQVPFGTPAACGAARGYSCPGARLHFCSYRISLGSCWLIPMACQGVLDDSPALRFGVCWAVHGSHEACLYHIFGLWFCSLLCFLT